MEVARYILERKKKQQMGPFLVVYVSTCCFVLVCLTWLDSLPQRPDVIVDLPD